MAEPPLETGAVQETVAEALPATALALLGAPGAVTGATGVTEMDDALALLVPTVLVAVTVKV